MLTELYQFGFIGSIIFMLYIVLVMSMKVYGKFVEKDDETKFVLTPWEKVLFWLSLTYVFAYII